MNALNCSSIAELRDLARTRLPRAVFDFIDGGAEGEVTLQRNTAAFDRIEFQPRVLVDVGSREPGVSILGRPASMPLIIAPTGLAALVWPYADVLLARAAGRAGAPFVISTSSSMRIEDIAKGAPDTRLWFQAYLYRDRGLVESLINRARSAGCEALVVAVDTPTLGKRLRDSRNRFSVPLRLTWRLMFDTLRCLGWTFGILRHGTPKMQNFVDYGFGTSLESLSALMSRNLNPAADWDDLRWVRDLWHGKLIIKGILSPIDASRAADEGVDAVWVSNHGGRQLDGAPSTMAALPAIKAAVGDRVEIYLDSGVRRGSDVVKAVALGARATAVGRATLYGVAAGGTEGADHALALLHSEYDTCLALLGCARSTDLNSAHVYERRGS